MEFCSQSKSSTTAPVPSSSSWQNYKTTFLGKGTIADFFLFEFIVVFVMPLPGKIGELVRRLSCKAIFGKLGNNVILEKDIVLRKPQYTTLGNGVRISRGTTLDVKSEDGRIVVDDHVFIGENTIINCIAGRLQIQHKTRIGKDVRLGSLQGLEIGEGSIIGDGAYISGAAHEYQDPELAIIDQPLSCRGRTQIGAQVIIGERVTINDGVCIGDNAEIAPDSLVNTDIPEKCYACGVPARVTARVTDIADE